MDKPKGSLKRPQYEMPDFVREALVELDLMDAYRQRPPYQQNDYIGWITRAKREETKQKRLNQMLEELKKGNVYNPSCDLPKEVDGTSKHEESHFQLKAFGSNRMNGFWQ